MNKDFKYKNTVGIEIPNAKRENVFLNEIIADEKFYKKDLLNLDNCIKVCN